MPDFPTPIATVDVVLLTLLRERLHVVLLRRGDPPFAGLLALPGGYVRVDEDASLEEAARRVLRGKAGLAPRHLEQLGSFGGDARDPRGWSISVSYYVPLSAGELEGASASLEAVPADALPSSRRGVTLTGNRIARRPESLGQRPLLQKLMLSGNRLQVLPDGLAGAPALELLRLSANRFERLPCWLPELPRLAWLAWAGNPMDGPGTPSHAATVPWNQLSMGPVLGEGASGTVRRATWTGDGAAAGRPVAVKLFKNAMTSDGLPGHEMAACLQAGEHPHLVGTLGRLAGHPSGTEGLVMTLLPDDWRPLAAPPSLRSCSRDVYDPALRLRPDAVLRIARGVGAATAHLHRRGLLHGDLYAHNVLWDGTRGDARLSDLGAASILPAPMPPASTPARTTAAALRRLDVLAWGVLLGELLQRCDPAPGLEPLLAVQRACTRPEPRSRPDLAEALASLP